MPALVTTGANGQPAFAPGVFALAQRFTQFEGLRRPPGADLANEVGTLRKQGSRVEVITPDSTSRTAMGINQMDPAARPPSARAGFAEGKKEASRMTFLDAWTSDT